MTDDTLDPPGSIAILGGGPVGIEAALYGRYLGYSVVLFEAERLVHRLVAEPDRTPPAVCTSPLGLAAVAAQRGLGGTSVELDLETYEAWVREYFDPLAASDLLAGRVRLMTAVQRLEWAPPEEESAGAADEDDSDDEDEDDLGEVPPDYLIHYVDARGAHGVERVEAVIDARGRGAEWIGPGEEPANELPAYYYRVGSLAAAETDYRGGLIQIRELFAALWGRSGLDVYRNLGGEV